MLGSNPPTFPPGDRLNSPSNSPLNPDDSNGNGLLLLLLLLFPKASNLSNVICSYRIKM